MNPLSRSLSMKLVAPMAGWATRLEEVPDPAFSQRMVGDGIAVDPTSPELLAPCDGVVVSVHASRHACTLRTRTGAEILLHIGIDTVGLRGEGFTVHVREGQSVRTGERLISFDMDLLARRARSLLTAMVVVNGEAHTITRRFEDRAVSAGEPLLELADGEQSAAAPEVGGRLVERRVQLLIPHGLHARPAAAFVQYAKLHAGAVTVVCGGRTANGKSVVSLMALGAQHGDTLTLSVQGEHSERVLQELVDRVIAGLGDAVQALAERSAAASPLPTKSVTAAPPFPAGTEVLLKGTPAVAGLAVGRAVRVVEETLELTQAGQGLAEEQRRLTDAVARVRRDIEAMISREGAAGAARTEIFQAHLALLEDPELTQAALREMASHSAEWSWRTSIEQQIRVLNGLENALMAERIGDLRDIGRRVIAALTGKGGTRVPAELPPQTILVADELLPSDLATLTPGRLVALCTARGGPTSHVAILAAGMGIPAVVAMGDALLRTPEGASLIVDGDRAEVRVHPPASTLEATERALATRATRRAEALAHAHEPCQLADGTRIEVFANLGRPGEAASAAKKGAEGCGLLRSEFLFLERTTAPSEDEQAAQYQEVAQGLGGHPVVIRTLDVGGDKPLAYLPLPPEQNPVLGLRGVRVSLRHPELLRTQVRAILRVRPAGACRILVPMITSASELREVRAVVEQERQALGRAEPILVGAMIEVPAAAVQSDQLAAVADFLSIGTNDLTQYALAMDRDNPHVAPQLDGLHPGVLRLVAQTVEGARKHGRPVAVCGGIASDPRAAPLLIGLGVTELSATPAAIPELKAFLRTLTRARCEDVARRALGLEGGDDVRALVSSSFPGL